MTTSYYARRVIPQPGRHTTASVPDGSNITVALAGVKSTGQSIVTLKATGTVAIRAATTSGAAVAVATDYYLTADQGETFVIPAGVTHLGAYGVSGAATLHILRDEG
jgi:hypothetical protein